MSLIDRLSGLWGGIIDSVSFDVVQHTAQLAIRLVEGGNTRHVRLTFSGISDFRFTNPNAGRYGWDYAELTEIHCNFQPDESVLTEIVMWEESSQLVVQSLLVDLEDVPADPAHGLEIDLH